MLFYLLKTYQIDFVFFSPPWHPAAFHLFKSDFLNKYWSDSSDFCINSTTDSHSGLFNLWAAEKILGGLLATRNSLLRYFREQVIQFFSSKKWQRVFLQYTLKCTLFLQKSMKHHSVEQRAVIFFVKKKLRALPSVGRSWTFWLFFVKEIRHSPIAYCVSSFWRSFFTNVLGE